MRTIETSIYNYSELSEKARDRVRAEVGANFGFERADEYFDSLKKLAEHFGGKLIDYEVDFWNTSYSSAKFEMPENPGEDEIGPLLADLGGYNAETLRGDGDCKLTGWVYDESAIDGFRIAFMRDGERDLDKLMEAAFRSWLEAAQADAAYDYSDEGLGETAEANEWEYYEDGRLVPPKVRG